MAKFGLLARIVGSPINYWGGYLCDLAAILFFLCYGISCFSGSFTACAVSTVAGWALWSPIEYGLHRWVFHGPRSPAKLGHMRHHQQPHALIGSPMVTCFSIVFVLWLVLRLAIAADLASFLAVGVTLGHVHFTVLHHVLHHWPGSERYLARLHRYHEVHHRRPRVNYGSTTVFWDRVFGTFDPGDPA